MKSKKITIIIITLCISLFYTLYQTIILQNIDVVEIQDREVTEDIGNL